MHVVVTGAAGFIGSHTCERLVGAGHRVTGVDAFDGYFYPADVKRGNATALARLPAERFRLIEADICDREAMAGRSAPTWTWLFDEGDSMWGVYRFKEGLGGKVIRTLGAWEFAPSPLWCKMYSEIIPRVLDVMRSRGKAKTKQNLGASLTKVIPMVE